MTSRLSMVRGRPPGFAAGIRGTRWTWLKDAHDWTRKQLNDFHWLSRARLKTATAWRLMQALRDI